MTDPLTCCFRLPHLIWRGRKFAGLSAGGTASSPGHRVLRGKPRDTLAFVVTSSGVARLGSWVATQTGHDWVWAQPALMAHRKHEPTAELHPIAPGSAREISKANTLPACPVSPDRGPAPASIVQQGRPSTIGMRRGWQTPTVARVPPSVHPAIKSGTSGLQHRLDHDTEFASLVSITA